MTPQHALPTTGDAAAARLADAIRLAYEGRLRQVELAEVLDTTQATVSRWVRGASPPALPDLPRIEEACDRPVGFILRAAGYVSDAATVPDAIDSDPLLPDALREPLKAAYRAMLPPEVGRRR